MGARRLIPLAVAAVLAGCGADRDEPPPLETVEPPAGTRTIEFPRAGLTATLPANWRLERRRAPGVFTLASGGGLVTAFAYPRSEPLPRSRASIAAAQDRLVRQVRARDPDFRLREAEAGEIARAPAIGVRGSQVIAGRRLETRSIHVYARRTEYVFEALAPASQFELVSDRVLTPLLATARLQGARGGSRTR